MYMCVWGGAWGGMQESSKGKLIFELPEYRDLKKNVKILTVWWCGWESEHTHLWKPVILGGVLTPLQIAYVTAGQDSVQ